MGNHTCTSQSLLSFKEEIRAQNHSFYVHPDMTLIPYTYYFISFSLAHTCTKIFKISQSLNYDTNFTFQICTFDSKTYGGSITHRGAKMDLHEPFSELKIWSLDKDNNSFLGA